MEEDLLQKAVKNLQYELEEKNQQIYDYKRQLCTAKALEQDYLLEIEVLQSKESVETKKLNTKMQQLEEEVFIWQENVRIAEQQMLKKDETIKKLNTEIKNVTENTGNSSGSTDELHKTVEENQKLKEEIMVLKEKLMEGQVLTDELQKHNSQLIEAVDNLKNELENVRQNVDCKKEELQEAKNLIHTLQEELATTKTEMESLKAKPLDEAAKGNSLFAEVNDRRLQIQKNMITMKKKYAEMKREISNKMKKISELRDQNTKLANALEEATKQRDFDLERQIDIYSSHITNLQKLLEDYKRDVAERLELSSKELPANTVEFVNNMIEAKRQEIEKARSDLGRESRCKMMLSLELTEANTELRKWKAQAELLTIKVDELEDKIQQTVLDNSLEDEVEIVAEKKVPIRSSENVCVTRGKSGEHRRNENGSSTKSILKVSNETISGNKESLPDESVNGENKENQSVLEESIKERRVMFTNDTFTPQETSKSKMRKGGRIIESKSIRISSTPNVIDI